LAAVMRRLLFTLALVTAVLAPATLTAGAEAPAPPAEVHASAEFDLRASNGFRAEFEGFEDRVVLTVRRARRTAGSRSGQYVIYQAAGELTARSVAVSFGRLGQISFRVAPTKTLDKTLPEPGCTGEPWTEKEGFFVGEAVLHGERGYTTIDVHRVKGEVSTSSEWDCPDESGPIEIDPGPLGREGREKVGVLRADDGGRRGFLALGGGENGHEHALFSAWLRERSEGMMIGRGAEAVTARPGSFVYDHRAGTAAARPPAPFSGHARFVRHGDAKQPGSWRGTLRVGLLGHDPIRLAGAGFEATLNRDPPGD
jgi:hypothetical protein